MARKTPTKTFEIEKSDTEWRATLTPEQYRVLREHGTERAGTSPLDKQYAPGAYRCAGCDLPLFDSDTKFDSGTGWPSFWAPLDNAVDTTSDRSFFMTRTEVHCRRCGGHLGHVFDDGPRPTGLRYCMNGAALSFKPGGRPPVQAPSKPPSQRYWLVPGSKGRSSHRNSHATSARFFESSSPA